MRLNLVGFALLLAAGLLLPGCGSGGSPKLSSQNKEAFSKASAELKQQWEQALKLDAANDYAGAGSNYFALLAQNLNPEQLEAVQTAAAAMNHRMYAAASKGDEGAKKAIEALNQKTRRAR
jgi:hypothetical protein